jgi:hypothetical protein
MIPLISTAKNPQIISQTTSNNKFPALMLSHDYGLEHKQNASGISGFHHEVAENCAFFGLLRSE